MCINIILSRATARAGRVRTSTGLFLNEAGQIYHSIMSMTVRGLLRPLQNHQSVLFTCLNRFPPTFLDTPHLALPVDV